MAGLCRLENQIHLCSPTYGLVRGAVNSVWTPCSFPSLGRSGSKYQAMLWGTVCWATSQMGGLTSPPPLPPQFLASNRTINVYFWTISGCEAQSALLWPLAGGVPPSRGSLNPMASFIVLK